jgi:coproporphyrinogen III oxidase
MARSAHSIADLATPAPLPDAATLADWKGQAAAWFSHLRDGICTAFEQLEDEQATGPHVAMAPGRFERTSWERTDATGAPGGGGTMAVMKGRVFEKVGVNISTVFGQFSPEFAKQIPGAADDPHFFATGISLVAHMRSPLVPAVHMNTRFLVTTKWWFGGGSDLNPPFPNAADTADFHGAFQAACDATDPVLFPRYKQWCDEYFYVPHRNRARGVGGIFYDDHNSGDWARDFAFTKAVGQAFLDIYPQLVRRRRDEPWTPEQREAQLRYRGLYAEFNLVYDRGTIFGLKTGGNVDAILMSLPPEAKWD